MYDRNYTAERPSTTHQKTKSPPPFYYINNDGDIDTE